MDSTILCSGGMNFKCEPSDFIIDLHLNRTSWVKGVFLMTSDLIQLNLNRELVFLLPVERNDFHTPFRKFSSDAMYPLNH